MTADSHALTPMEEEHNPVAHLAHDARGISNPVLGMLLFITSEVMFFAGLFAAYFNARAQAGDVVWYDSLVRPLTDDPTTFGEILQPLPFVFPATILLILSSFTCQLAIWAIRRNDRTAFMRNMTITLLLGITFLIFQVVDYSLLISEGLTIDNTPFGTTYYTLTGFHGAHVFGGAIMLAVVVYRGMAGQFSSRHHDMVEAASLYWHFVDVVWIVLYTLLYGGAMLALVGIHL